MGIEGTPATGLGPGADDVLEALDPEQREVACRPLGPLCVLAGAGTGKTRAITHRIAYGVKAGAYPPATVLAVTFTARAAGEMRTRLRDLGVSGVQARTFHAAALRQLHYFWPKTIGGAAPEVAPTKAPLVAEAAARLRLQVDRAALRDLASEVEWSKVGCLTAESYPAAATRAGRTPAGIDVTTVARLIQAYEDVKTDRGVIDFEDVLLISLGILAEHQDIAEEVRRQYRHFVVDEYQDVNVVQQRLLDLWVGDRTEVCVVGDPAQTIYSFAGASPHHLTGFARRYPQAAVIRLVRNYRSTPQIIGVANAVIGSGGPVAPSGVRSRGTTAVRLQAQRPAGAPPELTGYPDDEAEAAGVAAAIADLVAVGTPAAQIAVLFRINAQSALFEQALTERGIAYLLHGGQRFFARREVRAALVLLRGAGRSDDGTQPLGELTRDVLMGTGWSPHPPQGTGAVREQWESVTALAHLADDIAAARPHARLADLVAELDERAAGQHAPSVAGVTLASLHAAKGLEWDVVFLVGCSDGLVPLALAQGFEAIEEERRLAYVGITRARSQLRLSWAASRSAGGRASRKPSRFLLPAAALLGDPGLLAATQARPATQPRRRRPATACRTCQGELATAPERKVGRCANCPPTYDEATFGALREWRLRVSQEASVPAFVVFTDATLTAIAETRPADAAALGRIAGVGATKLSRYGEAVLAVLAVHSEA